jgi:hypothetical protein
MYIRISADCQSHTCSHRVSPFEENVMFRKAGTIDPTTQCPSPLRHASLGTGCAAENTSLLLWTQVRIGRILVHYIFFNYEE